MKILHFVTSGAEAKKLVRTLQYDRDRSAAYVQHPDAEIAARCFDVDGYTDLVVTYGPAYAHTVQVDAIVHHGLLTSARKSSPAVERANSCAPGAAIVYKYASHFEYT